MTEPLAAPPPAGPYWVAVYTGAEDAPEQVTVYTGLSVAQDLLVRDLALYGGRRYGYRSGLMPTLFSDPPPAADLTAHLPWWQAREAAVGNVSWVGAPPHLGPVSG